MLGSFLTVPAGAGIDQGPTAGFSTAERPVVRRVSDGALIGRAPWTNTACPEMTDSITRLYHAFFGRQPDQLGFEFWVRAFSQDGWNLDRMSDHFSRSDEFVDTYGALDDAAFVELLYRNIHARQPDDVGRRFWTSELESGRMSRGRVMIFFSESEEFVESTQTVLPLAGYLGWYPAGTTWSCGRGAAAVRMRPGVSHSDLFFENRAGRSEIYTITSYDPDFAFPQVDVEEVIPSGYYHYYDNIVFSPDFGYLEFALSDDVWWIVVDSPTPMVPGRAGWFD